MLDGIGTFFRHYMYSEKFMNWDENLNSNEKLMHKVLLKVLNFSCTHKGM